MINTQARTLEILRNNEEKPVITIRVFLLSLILQETTGDNVS